jgi:hypothetical protein
LVVEGEIYTLRHFLVSFLHIISSDFCSSKLAVCYHHLMEWITLRAQI